MLIMIIVVLAETWTAAQAWTPTFKHVFILFSLASETNNSFIWITSLVWFIYMIPETSPLAAQL